MNGPLTSDDFEYSQPCGFRTREAIITHLLDLLGKVYVEIDADRMRELRQQPAVVTAQPGPERAGAVIVSRGCKNCGS